MMRRVALLLAAACVAPAQSGDVILRAMRDEMERSRALRIVSLEAPYFIEYQLEDAENFSASASLGALINSNRVRLRVPRIVVRVGDYQFDNTNYVGTDYYGGTRWDTSQFPLDDSYNVLRRYLWLGTDTAFKTALEAYSRKRAILGNVNTGEELPDFWKAPPVELIRNGSPKPVDDALWTGRLRRLSSIFIGYPAVTSSAVEFQAGQSVQYIANSEGTRVRVPENVFEVRARATALAPDGMMLHDAVAFDAPDADSLPAEAEIERGIRELAANLSALAAAPAGDSYTGPVLFEGMAGAQIMAELLGRNLAASRRPVVPPGRTPPIAPGELEGRVGSRILPEWMDVVDDPLQTEWRGHALFGHYEVDMEGVVPKPLTLVERGVLKNLLLTRQPVNGFSASNGHARLPGAFGARTAAIGNLFVRASEGVPAAALKAKLIELCRQRNKPYGMLVRKMDFPSSAAIAEARGLLAASQSAGGRPVSSPILVYRVYQDGREELVRGLRFRGLDTRSLKDILAASSEQYAFDFLDNTAPFALTGGAAFVSEASVVAPAILIDDLEMDRAGQAFEKPPLVPPPPRDPRAAAVR
jgi:TldD protein